MLQPMFAALFAGGEPHARVAGRTIGELLMVVLRKLVIARAGSSGICGRGEMAALLDERAGGLPGSICEETRTRPPHLRLATSISRPPIAAEGPDRTAFAHLAGLFGRGKTGHQTFAHGPCSTHAGAVVRRPSSRSPRRRPKASASLAGQAADEPPTSAVGDCWNRGVEASRPRTRKGVCSGVSVGRNRWLACSRLRQEQKAGHGA